MVIQRICLCCMALFFFASVQAQVWTLPAKAWYGSVSYTFYTYNQVFDSTGNIVDIPVEVADKTIKLFAQYGVTDKLTLQAAIPYKMINSTLISPTFNDVPGQYITGGSLNYFSNIEFGGIYKLYNGKPIVTASFFADANSTDRNYITGLQTGFNSWGFTPGVGIGWGLTKSWLQYYLGANFRTNNYSTAIISNLEYGFKPMDYFYIAANVSLRQPVINSTTDCNCTTNITAMYLNEAQYLGVAIKAGFTINNFGFNAAINTAPLAENVPAAAVPTFGVQYKLEK